MPLNENYDVRNLGLYVFLLNQRNNFLLHFLIYFLKYLHYYLNYILNTEDIAVIVDAKHLCVSSRGIKDDASSTVTSYYGGQFKNQGKITELHNYINN